jgi:hypothetical protein
MVETDPHLICGSRWAGSSDDVIRKTGSATKQCKYNRFKGISHVTDRAELYPDDSRHPAKP